MFLYRNILKRALKLTWRFKYLWFFGLFAFLIDNGGEMEVMLRGFNFNMDDGLLASLKDFASTGVFSFSALSNLGSLLKSDPLTVFIGLAALLIMLVLGLFLLWLSVISQAAVVNNTANDIAGKDHNFQEGVQSGIKNFWPVFGLNIVLKIIVYLIFVLISLPVISSYVNDSQTSMLFIALFMVFVPIAILLSFIFKYSIAFVVIKDEEFVDAIKHGWQLFVDNWLVSLEMAFILFFVDLLYYLLLFWAILILSIPFIFIFGLLSNLAILYNPGLLISFAILTVLLVVIISRAIISTFEISSWTGLFVELTGRGAVSKIVRVFGK